MSEETGGGVTTLDAPAPSTAPRSRAQLIVSGLYSLGDRVAALVFGGGTIFMLTRLTTQETFGVWEYFLPFTATLEVARAGLLQNALIRYLNLHEADQHGAIHGGAWLLNASIAVIGFFVLWFGGPVLEVWFNAPGLGLLTRIYSVTWILMTPFQQFNYIQQANVEFRGIFWGTILRSGSMFVITLLGFSALLPYTLAEGELLIWLAWGQAGAAALAALISYYYARPFLPAELRLEWSWARKLFGFGKYVFGTNLSSMLYKLVDKSMLAALIGTAPVAVYGLAIRITNFVDVPTLSVASIVFPESSRASGGDGPGAQARMYEKAVAAIMACVLPALLVVAVVPGFFVNFLGGSAYAETIPVLQLTILYSLFVPFANQFGTLLDASGNPRLNFVFTLGGMMLNVVLNYVFITQYGTLGAPLGTLSTYAIMFGAMQWLLGRQYGVRLTNIFRALPGMYKLMWQFAREKLQRTA